MSGALAVRATAQQRDGDPERARPRLWLAAETLIGSSEVWIWRQLQGFENLDVHAIAWRRENEALYALAPDTTTLLPPFPAPQRRWLSRVRRLPGGNFWAAGRAEQAFLLRLARFTAPDVILAHFGPVALRLMPVARKLNVPMVVHFHGYDLGRELKKRTYRWSLAAALPSMAGMVIVGSHQKAILLDYGARPERIHLIPCGVPVTDFKQTTRRRAVAGVQFICVSRLTDVKGIDVSLRAFANIKPELPTARLMIVGDGPILGTLQQLARDLGIAEAVIFAGALPSDEVVRLLQESDIFLQHSLTLSDGSMEAFGVSIAEASACGLPVIVTRSGGIIDQVIDGKTGFLVEEQDVAAQETFMLRLAQDPYLRRKMGWAGRERMIEAFDTSRMIGKLEGVLLGAAGSPDRD